MISSYNELNELHIDVLREIGNIGIANAATSLGVLLDEDVSIGMPEVRVEGFDEVVGSIGGPEEMCVAVLVNFTGEARGVILFLLSMDDAKGIMGILATGDDDTQELSDIKLSGIKELGNILGSSYLGSIAALTGLRIDLSVPHIAVDMTGAILAVPVAEYGAADSRVMFIEESFSTKERRLEGHAILFADMETLQIIMERLGIEP